MSCVMRKEKRTGNVKAVRDDMTVYEVHCQFGDNDNSDQNAHRKVMMGTCAADVDI